MTLQHVLILIPGPVKYITVCDKRDFADVDKLRALRWGDDPGLSRWPQVITDVLKRRMRES